MGVGRAGTMTGMGSCEEPALFRMNDVHTRGKDGYSYFCEGHIGWHLLRCAEGFDDGEHPDTHHKVKTVTLEWAEDEKK